MIDDNYLLKSITKKDNNKMIKDNQKVTVKIGKINMEHYLNLNIDISDKIIEIDAKNLHKSSKEKVIVKCDICQDENTIKFVSYYNNISRGGFYTCIKCKDIKSKKTHKDKYGKFFNNRKKCRKTNLDKYGCENVSGSQIIKNKKIETNLKNWGVEYGAQNVKIQDKMDLNKMFLPSQSI